MMKSAQSEKYEAASQEDRCAPRTRVSIPSTLRPSGGKRLQTVVRDLSVSGFSAVAISRIAKGTSCWLTIAGAETRKAHVVWWEQGIVGCAFEQLLDAAEHDDIIARWRGDGQ
jgi:hypothetical protein